MMSCLRSELRTGLLATTTKDTDCVDTPTPGPPTGGGKKMGPREREPLSFAVFLRAETRCIRCGQISQVRAPGTSESFREK